MQNLLQYLDWQPLHACLQCNHMFTCIISNLSEFRKADVCKHCGPTGFCHVCTQHVAGRILESLPETQVLLTPKLTGFTCWDSSWVSGILMDFGWGANILKFITTKSPFGRNLVGSLFPTNFSKSKCENSCMISHQCYPWVFNSDVYTHQN